MSNGDNAGPFNVMFFVICLCSSGLKTDDDEINAEVRIGEERRKGCKEGHICAMEQLMLHRGGSISNGSQHSATY